MAACHSAFAPPWRASAFLEAHEMPRNILISGGTGYIMGDTADFAAGKQSGLSGPEEAARLLDMSIGAEAESYSVVAVRAAIPQDADGYYVYRSRRASCCTS